MRYLATLLFLLLGISISSNCLAQNLTIDEDFSDGDFTNNPTWIDHESKHTVNSSNALQLDAPSESNEAVITTSSSAAYGEWEVLVELGFNPSSSNLSRVYLISDSQNMKNDVNGYYIEVGNTSDEVSLYRQDESSTSKIIDGTDNLVDSNPVGVRIKVTRDLDGNWELFTDVNSGTSYTSQGTTIDDTHTTSNYIGLFSNYTSTRSDLFEYDDIKVTKVNPPIAIQQVDVVDDQTIDVTFNVDIAPASVSESNFSIDNGVGNPNTTNLPSSKVVRLGYDSSIPSGEYNLTVNDIDDTEGNTIDPNPTTAPFHFFGSFAQGDIIINEFAYDYPTTINEEYIEVRNISDKYLNLAGWQIADNNSNSGLDSGPIPIEPDSFLVISADTTELYNIFGERAYHETSFPALNNTSPDAVQLITNTGAKADSLTYTSIWGGTDIALERRSASTLSTFRENWGDSPNPDGGTPGAANEIPQDNTPPQLTELNILSTQTLQLTFDERLGQPGSYSINNPSISSTNQTAADTVELALSADLQNAQEYTLSISDVEDIFSNRITDTDTSFTFYEPSPVDSGDVAINEFMYAPPSGHTEYIELYNHSDKSLDLKDWTLSDNRESFEAIITSDQFIVPPNSFVVIAPDNTLLSDYPSIALVTMRDFPALNNSGDEIVIRKENGALLDSLQYNSEWGGNEVALERRSTSTSGTLQENWGDSPNPDGGTPGVPNEISVDTTPPFFEDLVVVDATTLRLVFSESITATDKQNYQIVPHRNIQIVAAQDNIVELLLSDELVSEQMYEVTASDISDIFGNTLSGATREITFLHIEDAQPSDIVINEIMYDPGDNEADFIELYNSSDKNFDLSNWLIGDFSNETSFSGGQLLADEYIVLTGNEIFANSMSKGLHVSGFPALNNNTEDAIYIKNQENQTIDSLRYSQTWGGSDGSSLERKDPQGASNDASNWQTSTTDNGYSAGAQNAGFQEDTSPPEIIFSKIESGGTVEVRFNEFIRLTDEVEFLMDEQELGVVNFDSANANIVTLQSPSAKSSKANSSTITAHNLSDVKGNTTASSEVAVAQPLQPADLVINEIMFNPLSDSDDNQPDQGEYIELRNTQDHAISLEGLFLHDEPDEDGEVRDLQPVTSTAKWVPAQGQVLVHADPAQFFEDSRVAEFFEINALNSRSMMRIDRTTLSLASSDDAIYIADSTGATIDSVFYSEEWHNPNIIDTRGVALERVTPDGSSNDDSNWGSSVNEKGGTPNTENSIYQESVDGPQETGISFTPNPFSPDNDGYEDNLFINYKLDHQDYLIDVQVYDRYGRLVRELADGKQAGFEGQLIWDGRKDDNSRNRIGIYIVVFEAYDSASGGDQSFKKTAVLARRLN